MAPEVDVVIEVTRGSFLKRGSTAHVDFVSPLPCPFNYGSVPWLGGNNSTQVERSDGVRLMVRWTSVMCVLALPRYWG